MRTAFHPDVNTSRPQSQSHTDADASLKPMLKAKTFDSHPFRVPSTRDPLQTFTTSAAIGPAEAATLLVILSQLCTLPWITRIPRVLYLLNFALWRLNYNVGLGLLLYFQSRSQFISRFVSVLPRDARALLHWVVRPAVNPTSVSVTTFSDAQTDLSQYPHDFIAWLAFRSVAACVLANDGISFALLALSYWLPSISFNSPFSILTSLVSLALAIPIAAIAVWAKLRAHQSLGDFGWFWGDFFFLLDRNSSPPLQNHTPNHSHDSSNSSAVTATNPTSKHPTLSVSLSPDSGFVSDGVFAVFPHPMYTAGYLIYFATAFATRSSVLLSVAAATQISQLLFLHFVEQPHMTKVYEGSSKSQSSSRTLTRENGSSDEDDNPALRLFEQGAPHFVTVLTTASTFAAIVLCSTVAFRMRAFVPSRITIVLIALVVICARALFWVFLTFMLSKPKYGEVRWVVWLRLSDTPHSRIFTIWQHVLLLLTFANHALFLILAIASSSFSSNFFNPSLSALFDSSVLASTLCAALLIFIGTLASVMVTREAGVFAVYYGDFFLHPGRFRTPCTNAPFSYVRHPDLTLSYLIYYGLACLARSPFTTVVALICQLMHVIFVHVVEEPHMATVYPNFVIHSSPWVKALQRAPIIAPVFQSLSQSLCHVTQSGVKRTQAFSSSISIRADRACADAAKNIAHVNSRATCALDSLSPSDLACNPRFTAWCINLRACLQNLGVDVPAAPNAS